MTDLTRLQVGIIGVLLVLVLAQLLPSRASGTDPAAVAYIVR